MKHKDEQEDIEEVKELCMDLAASMLDLNKFNNCWEEILDEMRPGRFIFNAAILELITQNIKFLTFVLDKLSNMHVHHDGEHNQVWWWSKQIFWKLNHVLWIQGLLHSKLNNKKIAKKNLSLIGAEEE